MQGGRDQGLPLFIQKVLIHFKVLYVGRDPQFYQILIEADLHCTLWNRIIYMHMYIHYISYFYFNILTVALI